MTLNKLASAIAKREGKRSQTAIYNIREVIRILVELDAESTSDFYPDSRVGDVIAALMIASGKLQRKLVKRSQARKKQEKK